MDTIRRSPKNACAPLAREETMNWRVALAVLGCVVALLSAVGAQEPAAPTASPFVGADACKECHADHYQVWSDTKHAKSLNRLSQADRESGQCIRCHVTGTPEMIAAEGSKPSLPGVQCEACHGAGRPHLEATKAGVVKKGLIARKPDEKNCTQCHNPASPHYRPFYYAAMTGLVHRIKK
jgi:hypothetical protein